MKITILKISLILLIITCLAGIGHSQERSIISPLNKKILALELQNLADAKELQSISLERYRIGKAAMLETIETQNNLEEAQARYIQALFDMKMAETDLLRAEGSLVK